MSDAPFDRFATTEAYRDAVDVIRALAADGHVALLAGGCVRDALLGSEPKDYDVATSARPEAVRARFRRSQGVGQAFGVVLVRMPASQIEVATFRQDGGYADGRRPDSVTYASDVEDARRRDFTINGMFFDPIAGRLIDHVGGSADLGSRTLRAIGDASSRFGEDYLRLLRAIRFAARFGLTIEPQTADAIASHAERLPRIAPERVADELRSMLSSATSGEAVRLLDAFGLMPVLMRRVEAAATQSTVVDSGRLLRAIGQPLDFPLALAAIVADRHLYASPDIANVTARSSVFAIDRGLRDTLRYSNDESAAVRDIFTLVSSLIATTMPSVSLIKRCLARPRCQDALRLLRALDTTGHAVPHLRAVETLTASFPPESIAPSPLLTGDDLAAMGVPPSAVYKRVLDATYDAQLEGHVTSSDAARAFARAMLPTS